MDDQYRDILPNLRNWIKERLKKTIAKSQLTYDYLAMQMGISAARLFNQTDTQNQKDRFHLDNLLILIKETGDFSILDNIEAALGRVAFPQPEIYKGLAELNREVADYLKKSAECAQTIIEVIEDAKITPEEREAVQESFRKALAQLGKVMGVFEQAEQSQGKKLRAVGE